MTTRLLILLMVVLCLGAGNPVGADEPSLPVFTDITDTSGVEVKPALWSFGDVSRGVDPTFFTGSMKRQQSAGVALEDLDGDGRVDVLIADQGQVHVFQGNGRGRFRRRPALPLQAASLYAQGLAVGDVDNDGRVDVYVGVLNGPNHLFHQNGPWRFSERGLSAGVAHPGSAYSVNMVDYDNDGWLDLFVCNYGSFLKDTMNIRLQFDGRLDPMGDPSQRAYLRERNALYRNRGDGTFADVTVEAGLTAEDFSLASAWADYDGDGDQDLFVANDFGVSRLYRNNGNGRFTDLTSRMGYLNVGAGMSAAWGDVNNDGRLDLYVGNMYSHSAHRLMQENHASFAALPPTIQRIFERLVSGNTLLIQQAGGTFRNDAPARGVDDGSWSWGALLADFNTDGWLDIYVANGWTRGTQEGDYCATFWGGFMEGMQWLTQGGVGAAAGPAEAEQRQKAEALWYAFSGETGRAPNVSEVDAILPFLDQEGNLDVDLRHIPRIGEISWDGYNKNRLFVSPTSADGAFLSVEQSPVIMDEVSRTVGAGDIDHDGDIDLVVVSTTAEVKVFRNDSPPHHWVTLVLKGTQSNRSAVGAQVLVSAQGQRWLREVSAGSGFCSHQSLELEVGLGTVSAIDEIQIRWPSGVVQQITHPPIDRRLTIRELPRR